MKSESLPLRIAKGGSIVYSLPLNYRKVFIFYLFGPKLPSWSFAPPLDPTLRRGGPFSTLSMVVDQLATSTWRLAFKGIVLENRSTAQTNWICNGCTDLEKPMKLVAK